MAVEGDEECNIYYNAASVFLTTRLYYELGLPWSWAFRRMQRATTQEQFAFHGLISRVMQSPPGAQSSVHRGTA